MSRRHHDHEHEVTAQIHVPASRIQLVGVFREQVTRAGISCESVYKPKAAAPAPLQGAESELPWDVEYVCTFSLQDGTWTAVEEYAPLPPQGRGQSPVEVVTAAMPADAEPPRRADLLLDGSQHVETEDGKRYRIHAC